MTASDERKTIEERVAALPSREELQAQVEALRTQAKTLKAEGDARKQRRADRRAKTPYLLGLVRETVHRLLLEQGPLHDDGVLVEYSDLVALDVAPDVAEQTIRMARGLLVTRGLVEATGETALTRKGRPAKTWRVVGGAMLERSPAAPRARARKRESRPAFREAWIQTIGAAALRDGTPLAVIVCPYCGARHGFPVTRESGAGYVIAVCGQGLIRLRTKRGGVSQFGRRARRGVR